MNMTDYITTESPHFRGRWPSSLKVRCPGYAGTLHYVNANGNGWYEDEAAGTLDRRWLIATIKSDPPDGMTAIRIAGGYATIALSTHGAPLSPLGAKDLAAQLDLAIKAAEAFDEFIQELIPDKNQTPNENENENGQRASTEGYHTET